MTLESKETAELSISFDTTSRTGKQTKKVMIYANSPENPYTEITISTSVKE